MSKGARQNNNKDLFISFIIREHLVNNFKDLFATIFLMLKTGLFNQHSTSIESIIKLVLYRSKASMQASKLTFGVRTSSTSNQP